MTAHGTQSLRDNNDDVSEDSLCLANQPMDTVPSLTELRELRAAQRRLLLSLEFLKRRSASESRKAAVQGRIATVDQSIRDFDLVIAAIESA
jgi:hypothetical protein